jgi:hypothetical protein
MADGGGPATSRTKDKGEAGSPAERPLPEQLAKVLPFIATVVGTVTAIYGLASPYARTRSGKIWLTLGVSAAVLLVGITMVLLYNLGRKFGSKKLRLSVSAVASAIVIILAVGTGATYLIWHAKSSSPSVSITNMPSGTIASPESGASNVCANSILRASGTARNIQRGHRLWLFLYVASAGGGTGLYYPADHATQLLAHGRWSGDIYVGGTGQAGEQFRLWLADLGSQGLKKLGINIPGPSPGFTSLHYAPDVATFYSVTFTTINCP